MKTPEQELDDCITACQQRLAKLLGPVYGVSNQPSIFEQLAALDKKEKLERMQALTDAINELLSELDDDGRLEFFDSITMEYCPRCGRAYPEDGETLHDCIS